MVRRTIKRPRKAALEIVKYGEPPRPAFNGELDQPHKVNVEARRRPGRPPNKSKGLSVSADGTPLAPVASKGGRRARTPAEPAIVEPDEGEAIVSLPPDSVISKAAANQAEAFEQLLKLSMAHSISIMKMKLPPAEDKNFGPLLRIKQQIAASVLTAVVRVDSSPLRNDGGDQMEVLLADLKKEALQRQKSLQKLPGGLGDAVTGETFDETSLL